MSAYNIEAICNGIKTNVFDPAFNGIREYLQVSGMESIPILLATTNKTKIKKFRKYINYMEYTLNIEFSVYSIDEFGYDPNCPEPYFTFEQNASLKANVTYFDVCEDEIGLNNKKKLFIILANDSGLRVNELNGWPGVKTKRNWLEFVDDHPEVDTSAKGILYNTIETREKPILNGEYVSATTALLGGYLLTEVENPVVVTNTKSSTVRIIDPRKCSAEFANYPLETMWDVTTPAKYNPCEDDGPFTIYEPKPISAMSDEQLMLLDDPMFKSCYASLHSILNAIANKISELKI